MPVSVCICKFHAHSEFLLQELRKRQKTGEEAHPLQRIDSVRSQEEELSKEEVIRRLRLLGQPITLFGEVRPDFSSWKTRAHHSLAETRRLMHHTYD